MIVKCKLVLKSLVTEKHLLCKLFVTVLCKVQYIWHYKELMNRQNMASMFGDVMSVLLINLMKQHINTFLKNELEIFISANLWP